MKLFIFVLALAAAHADVSHIVSEKDQQASVVRSASDVKPDGYSYEYETSNGIAGQATGQLKTVDNQPTVVSQGTFQYVSPDGTPVQLSYVADENGFQPQGAHLPTAPPVPEYIIRAVEWSRTHQPQEVAPPGKPNRFA